MAKKLKLLRKTELPKNGITTYHLEQRYQGIPVWGERVTVATTKSKKAKRIGGFAVRELAKSGDLGKPKLTADEALTVAKSKAGVGETAKIPALENSVSKLVVYYDEKSKRSILAYETSFFAARDGNPTKPVTIVDAQTGEVLLSYENLQHLEGSGPGGTSKTGCYYYGKNGMPPLNIKRLKSGMCALDSENVVTWNCNHTKGEKCVQHSFTCHVNKTKEINGGCAPMNDAHFFGHVVFDMYSEWYGIRALKGKLNMFVHYGSKIDNAYWNGKAMLFGDGNTSFHPLTSLDVTSHEVSQRLHRATFRPHLSGTVRRA